MNLRLAPALAAIVLLVGPACQRGPLPGHSRYAADRFCVTLAEAHCELLYGCCNDAERRAMLADFVSPATEAHANAEQCVAAYTKDFCPALAPYADSVISRRGTWDTKKAKACWGFYEEGAKSCDPRTFVLGGVDVADDCLLPALLEGKVGEAGVCFQDAECADETAQCLPIEAPNPDEELVSAKGTCRGAPGVGKACAPGNVCAEGLWCDSVVDPPVCRQQKAVGETCNDALECSTGVCDAGSCADKLFNGDPCVTNSECLSTFCDAATTTCEDRRQNGDACTYDAQCVSGACSTASNTCRAPSDEINLFFDICKG